MIIAIGDMLSSLRVPDLKAVARVLAGQLGPDRVRAVAVLAVTGDAAEVRGLLLARRGIAGGLGGSGGERKGHRQRQQPSLHIERLQNPVWIEPGQ
jgi:hypothetical protein